VAVRDGVVTIPGRVEQRSAVSGLATAATQADSMIQVDQHTTYTLDDRYPITPICW
jgi:hypothetical protein